MMRWDIINHLIKKNNYKSYLEIGYYKGWSFDNVNCERKHAVDPNPCKMPEQEKIPYGGTEFIKNGHIIYKETSDDYFKKQEPFLEFRRECDFYDIIFIDGLHSSDQVSKDILNSLNHLSENGIIVLHDCNPPLYEHTTIGLEGCWTGDAYKAFVDFRRYNTGYQMFTIDTDWGVGIIQNNPLIIKGKIIRESYPDTWEYFNTNRKELLNLISVEEFLKSEKTESINAI